MFKSQEQIDKFVDNLEVFIKACITEHFSVEIEDTAYLNRMRDKLASSLSAATGLTNALSNVTDTYPCPECGREMALRTNRQNGNKFWGCKRYPDCKGTRDENGLSKEERAEAKRLKEEASQQDGFSFNRSNRSAATEVSPPEQTTWVNPFKK